MPSTRMVVVLGEMTIPIDPASAGFFSSAKSGPLQFLPTDSCRTADQHSIAERPLVERPCNRPHRLRKANPSHSQERGRRWREDRDRRQRQTSSLVSSDFSSRGRRVRGQHLADRVVIAHPSRTRARQEARLRTRSASSSAAGVSARANIDRLRSLGLRARQSPRINGRNRGPLQRADTASPCTIDPSVRCASSSSTTG